MENKSLIKDIENKKVKVRYINKEIDIDEKVRINIEKYWKTVENIFRRGKIFVIKDIKEENENINIDIYFSDYAHYIYTKKNSVPIYEKCKNLWSGILLETSDNKYLFGEMSEITASAGEYHISGGSCDEEEIEDGYMNFEKTMYRELKEEFNLDKEDLEEVKIKYLKLASLKESDIGILYKGKLNKTSKEIQIKYNEYLKYLKNTNGEIEFNKLIFVDKNVEEVKSFLKTNDNILMEFTKDMLLYDIKQ